MTRDFDYVMIVGTGRSGTNWLLGLFDLSPETFCRNEPGFIPDSLFSALEDEQYHMLDTGSRLPHVWDAAVEFASTHCGERDHAIVKPKPFIRPLASSLGLHALVHHGGWREKVLSKLLPSLRKSEWRLPWWLGSQEMLEHALPILKDGQPGWMQFVLRHRPRTRVIHIVRHAGGYLNSWRHRVLDAHARDKIASDNRTRLEHIARSDETWAGRLGDIAAMTVVESELWYWVYFNEVVRSEGAGRPAYTCVTFEDLAERPVEHLRRLFASVGLSWTPEIERWTVERCARSKELANKWRDRLGDGERDEVARCVENSALADLWPPTETASPASD